jgi:type I restriction enzyme S subunit
MYTVFATSGDVHPPFLYALFKTELYRHIFAVNTNSSVNRRGGLRWAQFSQLPVALPELPEQQEIADIVETCDREILLLQRKLEAIQAQKKGLMHKLLTGGIHLKAMSHV